MIQVEDVHKSFGEVKALVGVRLEAPDGAITGLLGPNGAGKTTALRILYTALEADQGRVLVDGLDARLEREAVQQRLGVMPHARGLYVRLTAREHIRYFGRLHGMTGAALEARCQSLIDTFGMADFADRRAKGYSEGQRVKVAIARALVHDPRNVILDEPTSGLDVMSTRALRDTLRTLRDQGKCVLLSSHIMQEVSLLCDQIVLINGGRTLAQGTRAALLEATGQTDLEDAFVAAIAGDTAVPSEAVS